MAHGHLYFRSGGSAMHIMLWGASSKGSPFINHVTMAIVNNNQYRKNQRLDGHHANNNHGHK